MIAVLAIGALFGACIIGFVFGYIAGRMDTDEPRRPTFGTSEPCSHVRRYQRPYDWEREP